jgi:hypothetical protein
VPAPHDFRELLDQQVEFAAFGDRSLEPGQQIRIAARLPEARQERQEAE